MPHLVEDITLAEARQHFAQQFTDQAGAFPNGGSAGQGNSVAERMSLAAETEMRSFRKIAEHVQKIVRAHQPERWSFAAPAEINGAILDGVSEDCRKHLTQNIPKDLVNQPVSELMEQFAGS